MANKRTIVSNGISSKGSNGMPAFEIDAATSMAAMSEPVAAASVTTISDAEIAAQTQQPAAPAPVAQHPIFEYVRFTQGRDERQNALFDGSRFTVIPAFASGKVPQGWIHRESRQERGKTFIRQAEGVAVFRPAIKAYQEQVAQGQFKGGSLYSHKVSYMSKGQPVERTLLFLGHAGSTDYPASIKYIQEGLNTLVDNATEKGLVAGQAITLTKIGVTDKGLTWKQVGPELAGILGKLPAGVRIRIYVGQYDALYFPVYGEDGSIIRIDTIPGSERPARPMVQKGEMLQPAAAK